MFEGELEILEMKEQHRKTPNTNSGGDKKGVTTGKGDSLYEIMSMPGMKLSEKAKKRLLKIRDKKMKAKNG